MSATGIVREIDKLGRVVIPKEYRKVLGLEEKDEVEMCLVRDDIVLKKYNATQCIFCGGTNDLISHHGKLVCKDCRESLGNGGL